MLAFAFAASLLAELLVLPSPLMPFQLDIFSAYFSLATRHAAMRMPPACCRGCHAGVAASPPGYAPVFAD